MKISATTVALASLLLGAIQPALAVPTVDENHMPASEILQRDLDATEDLRLVARGRPKIPGCKDSEAYYLCVASMLLSCFSGPASSGNQACQGRVSKSCNTQFCKM